MLLSTRGGVPNVVGGDLGDSRVTSKMGNGTKFKLSSVLPNVFSKIKGIRRNSSVQKLSSSASVMSESVASDVDQKDFSTMSRDSHGDRSPPPLRSLPQNKNGHTRHTPSPVHSSQKTHDVICFPAESPVRTKGSTTSRSFSPPSRFSPPTRRIQGSAEIVDPGCCSYDSTMALVPHDGRVRRVAPQAIGKCLIMSKCNSFNGSTQHSDSEVSETDSSRTQARIRHSRVRSAQLEGSSCEGYGLLTSAEERSNHRSGKVSIRHRSSERREQNVKMVDRGHELYGGSSPIDAARSAHGSYDAEAKPCRADHSRDRSSNGRGSGSLLNSSKDGTDLDRDRKNGRNGCRPSRKLNFSNNDNARAFDDTSLSSDDDFYKVVTRNGKVAGSHYRSRSTSSNNNSQGHMYDNNSQGHMYCGNQESTDLDYTSSEVVYTEDERSHGQALLRREALLAKTVLNASDGWAQVQMSRFSHHDEKLPRRASYDSADRPHKGGSELANSREETLVKTVLNAQGWARENLRALANANELDRQTLARLRAASLDLLGTREEEAADKIEYETFGLSPDSREFFTRKSSRHPSPIGEEVEKYTEGRVDYKTTVVHEESAQPVADHDSNLCKGARSRKPGKESGKPWDTEFHSFRSDSILMGGGIGSDRISVSDERAALIDCTECESPAALTPRYLERQRQSKIRGGQQQQEFRNYGKVSSTSPSPKEEVMSPSLKNVKPSSQSASPRLSSPRLSTPELSSRPKRLPSSMKEFSNGKKMPSRTPSPSQDIKGARRSTSRTPLPVQDSQQVKSKSSRTPSPARSQSPRAGGKPLTAKAEAGMQRLDSVAVVKSSYDPYQDFRESMVEMILENDIRTSQDLEDLLQCYLSLNSPEYHKIIVEVFTDVWGDIFDQ